MAMSYYKTFRVPFWVILDKTKKSEKVMDWFRGSEAKVQKWPAVNFKETLSAFKNKGWAHVFKEKNIVIPPQLLAMAIGDHVKEYMTPFAQFDFLSLHRLNRELKKDSDYERIFNEVIGVQEPIVLSQTFQVAETCFNESSPSRPLLWITEDKCERSVISKIADNIVTIGEGAGFDLNIKSVKEDKIEEFLSNKMVDIFKT